MKENEDDNNKFYYLSENNIVNSNNNLILPFENNSTKHNNNFDDKSKNEPYKIILGKYNEANQMMYESNKISTSKYTLLNFIPKILMEQLSRICNVYLLVIALFQSIKSISYTDGYPLILIPLTMILLLIVYY